MKKLTDYPYNAEMIDLQLSFEEVIKPVVNDISDIYQLDKRTVKKLITNALSSNDVQEAIFDEVQSMLGDDMVIIGGDEK